MIREILIWPDPRLAMRCAEVAKFDEGLEQLLTDMAETMLHAHGAGLAAPQVGILLRAVTILVNAGGTREVLKLVNPRIVETRGSVLRREGCLSLPGHFEMVRRFEWVRVEALDEKGGRVEVAGDGVLGHALQHELDHLEGKVFVDFVSPLKRNRALATFRKAKARGMRYRGDEQQKTS